jgi:hypothetical protein
MIPATESASYAKSRRIYDKLDAVETEMYAAAEAYRDLYLAELGEIVLTTDARKGMSVGEYEIHVTCFARILHNGKILLTTQDYQSWDEKDHKHNDMYHNIAKHGATLIGQTVRSVEMTAVNDLFITLTNDVKIEILSSNGSLQLSDKNEQWFFYKPKDKTYPYLSVTNNGIETELEE